MCTHLATTRVMKRVRHGIVPGRAHRASMNMPFAAACAGRYLELAHGTVRHELR